MDSLSALAFPEISAEPVRFEVLPEVRKSLGALALAVNHALEEEQLRVAAFALRDLPPSLLRAACLRLGQTERFWPKPVEIRDVASAILADEQARQAAAKLLPLPKSDDDSPRVFCFDCKDEPNALRLFWCQGAGDLRVMEKPDHAGGQSIAQCGRSKKHPPHTFAEKCACEPTNPVIAEIRKRMGAARQRREQRRAS